MDVYGDDISDYIWWHQFRPYRPPMSLRQKLDFLFRVYAEISQFTNRYLIIRAAADFGHKAPQGLTDISAAFGGII